MRILHTSDFHLSEGKPNTVSALEEILRVAKRHSVDLLTIGGDLFESEEDAEALRSKLRGRLSNNGFEIIAIPGNHDREAYAHNLDFGSDITVVTESPFKVITRGDVTIVALPFVESHTRELLSSLREAARLDTVNMLLLHCTLDIGFSTGDFGEEPHKYFPISTETLSTLGYDFVLAGHFHRTTYIRNIEDKGQFIYSGSPLSHTRKETGKRNAVLIDVQTKKSQSIPLRSFYYDNYTVTVQPGEEDQSLGIMQKWLKKRRKDICSLKLVVDGFIETDEKEFRNRIEEIAAGMEVEHRYRNVSEVLNHPLFNWFTKELDKKDIAGRGEVRDKVIDAMARLLRSRELRT